MKQLRLNLYLIDMKYIRNLAKADDNVMSVSPQIERESTPFVAWDGLKVTNNNKLTPENMERIVSDSDRKVKICWKKAV